MLYFTRTKRPLVYWSLCALVIVLAVLTAFFIFRREPDPTFNIISIITNTGDTNNEVDNQNLNSKPTETSLIAVGDIMLSRVVGSKLKKNGFDYSFRETAEYLKTGDIVFGNLETSITPGRQINTGELSFRADPGVETAMKDAGFSLVSLANNHTPNFGAPGLSDTFSYLNAAGIDFVGAGENEEQAYAPVYIERLGLTFAFLAYNDDDVVPAGYKAGSDRPGTAFMDIAKLTESIQKARERANFVIISMHSGTEYTTEPNKSQKEFAHAAIDAGAELVIGHHPHVIQKAEIYQGKYIFYSLGNFVFDQMWSQETREGLVAKFLFNAKGLFKIEFLPIIIYDYAQPKAADTESAIKMLDILNLENIINNRYIELKQP
ncbi:MAG: CapA family protein [Patescibacteria group bacterium]|nr:CapA family protein [Patescibacteria group bacterium]